GASQQLDGVPEIARILTTLALPDRLRGVVRLVGRCALSDPEADGEGLPVFMTGFVRSPVLQRADEPRCPLELLKREQAERVPHQDTDAGSVLVRSGAAKAAMHQRERDESEICLGLSAARREPQEISEVAVFRARVCEPLEVLED